MVKRAISLAVIGIFLLGLIPAYHVSAAPSAVILVSDNPADMAMARFVANFTGYPVVVTGWGVYNMSVSMKVLSYHPSKVIIIGGPLAVPEEYAEGFQKMNVSVVRWGGENRYETNLRVISALKELGVTFSSAKVLVPGNASPAISIALKTAVREHSLLVYINSTAALQEVGGNVTIILPQWMKSLKMPEVAKIKHVDVTARWAAVEVNRASSRLGAIERMANGTNSTEILRMVELARKNIAEAKDCLAHGEYVRAYTLASIANGELDSAVKLINLDPEAKLNAEAADFEFYIHGMKQISPEQDAKMEALMKEYREALKNHDYKRARRIMWVIEFMFMRCYADDEGGPIGGLGNTTGT